MYLSYIRECKQKKQRDENQDGGAIATLCHCCENETFFWIWIEKF